MQLTELSIRRPLTMLMVILGMVVLGWRAYGLLKVDRMPKADFPIVTISTVFLGASPEDIEDLVVKPIEDAVAGISGIDELTSRSLEGYGLVIVTFVEGIDGNQAAIDVGRQVATARNKLPAEADDPVIIKADFNAIPVMELVLNGPQGKDVLYELADDKLKTRFQGIKGVASVSVSGGRKREVVINLNPDRLAAYGLTVGAVQQALSAANVTFPAGTFDEGRHKTSVRSFGQFTTIEEIKNMVIAGNLQGDSKNLVGQDDTGFVYLRDVAEVKEDYEDRKSILRYNGKEAVSISITKAGDANTVELADKIRQEVEAINKDLPTGSNLEIAKNDAIFIKDALDAVEEDLVLAVLITGIVMLVFLHTIRSTFIVLLAVPTSIISTFLVMWRLGFSLNQLTLMALTLVIGILVDDSIVVIENIERHLKMKKPRWEAALQGRSEIGFAAIAITLVDVVVYLPVAFLSGIIGQFFYSYGITIAVAALFSLFVAFTLTPMLASRWMQDESKPETAPRGLSKFFDQVGHYTIGWWWHLFVRAWDLGFENVAKGYAVLLRLTLKNVLTQSLAIFVALIALGAGLWMVATGVVGSEFIPSSDEGQITISFEMPPSTTLDETDRVARHIEQIVLQEIPETVSILTNVGGGASGGLVSGGSSSHQANMTVKVTDKQKRTRSTEQMAAQLRPIFQKIPEALISMQTTQNMGGGGASTIQIRISGPDQNKLIDLANQVESVIKTVPGASDVKNTDARRSAEKKLVVDRDKAKDLKLSSAQIASALRTAVSGSKVGSYKRTGQNEIDIILRMNEDSRKDLTHLLQLPVGFVQGKRVTLEQLVHIENDLAPSVVNRADRQRILTVGNNSSGRTSGDVTDDIETAVQKQVTFPLGYSWKFTGASEMQRESFAQLVSALYLSIGLSYMLLVALYQSWLQPLAIMFALPVTLVGAFGGLWVTGNTLNIISLLGIILLAGVVTKNAILLIDFTNSLREQGYARKEALIAAGQLRLRAILMTTLTIIFSLFPLLLGKAAGSEMRAPLAAVVMGGLTSSTLLTLILVPVVYNFFDWGSGLATQITHRVLGSGDEPERIPIKNEEGKEDKVPERRPQFPPKQVPQPSVIAPSVN